ncbi:MAG: TetR/AcrR family transcriptional regulator [Bacillota bacterium]
MMQGIGKRAKKKLETRQIIAETALDLIVRQGLNETSIAEIMGKAGLGTGTFYNYFDSKEEVLKCCLAERIDMASQACEDIQSSDLSPTEKLIQILQVVGNTYDKNRQLVELYLRYYHSSDLDGKEPPHGRRFVEVLAKIIAEGQKKGEFRKDIPCEIIVEMFTAILKITMSSGIKLTFIENINFKRSILLDGIVERS